ncbi:hypothetical protein D9M73_179050 [compost metagenome]
MGPGLVDDLRRLGVLQPAADGGQVIHACAFGDSGHGAAVRVPADHDVGHTQHGDGVLDRGRHTTRMGAVGGHDVARVTDDEQLAGFLLGQQFRHDAAVGAGDEQGARMLRGRQVFEQVGALRKHFLLKLQKTFDERLHA